MAFSDNMNSIIAKGGTPVDISMLNPASIYAAGRDIRQEDRNRRASIKFNQLASQYDPTTPQGLNHITNELASAGLAEEAKPIVAQYVKHQSDVLANNQAASNVDSTNLANTKTKGDISNLIAQHFQEDVDRGNTLIQSGVNPEDAKKYVKTWMQNRLSTAPDQFKFIAKNLYDKHAAMVDAWGQPQAPAAAVQGVKPEDVGKVAEANFQAKTIAGIGDTKGKLDAVAEKWKVKPPTTGDESSQMEKDFLDAAGGTAAIAASPMLKKMYDEAKAVIKQMPASDIKYKNVMDPKYQIKMADDLIRGKIGFDEVQDILNQDPNFLNVVKARGGDVVRLKQEFDKAKEINDNGLIPKAKSAVGALQDLRKVFKKYGFSGGVNKLNGWLNGVRKQFGDAGIVEIEAAINNAKEKTSMVPGVAGAANTVSGLHFAGQLFDPAMTGSQMEQLIGTTQSSVSKTLAPHLQAAGAVGKRFSKDYGEYLRERKITDPVFNPKENKSPPKPGGTGGKKEFGSSSDKPIDIGNTPSTPELRKKLSGKWIKLPSGKVIKAP